MHKSQGFGAAERRGPVPNHFELLRRAAGASGERDLLQTSRGRHDRLDRASPAARRWTRFSPRRSALRSRGAAPCPSGPGARPRGDGRPGRRPVGRPEARGARRGDPLVRGALDGGGRAATLRDCPGGTIPVTVSVLNRSGASVTVAAIEMPHGATLRSAADSTATFQNRPLQPNVPLDGIATVTLPAADATSRIPSGFGAARARGASTSRTPALDPAAENPPALRSRSTWTSRGSESSTTCPFSTAGPTAWLASATGLSRSRRPSR